MTYLDTMNDIYPAWTWFAWVVGAILLVVCLSLIMNELSDKGRGKVLFPATVGFIIGAVLAASPYAIMVRSDHKIENLAANIQAKYNVQSVVTDYPSRLLVGKKTSQEVVVVTPQGQTVIFVLKQDPKTFEPTLLDTAIQSGTAPTGAITVKDITR